MLSSVKLFIAIFMAVIFYSCSKDDQKIKQEIEEGEYVGTYTSGSNFQQNFRININKRRTDEYEISQISAGDLPSFYIKIKVETPGVLQFHVPEQNSAGVILIGVLMQAGSYDGAYVEGLKQITFSFAVKGSQTQQYSFTGVKI